jgi:hypothetical protein
MDTLNNFRGEFEVSFKGKQHKALFTMNTLRLITKNEMFEFKDFDKWVSNDPLTSVPLIAYYSIANACIYSGKKFVADKDMFIAEMLDTGQLEVIADAMAAAMKSEDKGKK